MLYKGKPKITRPSGAVLWRCVVKPKGVATTSRPHRWGRSSKAPVCRALGARLRTPGDQNYSGVPDYGVPNNQTVLLSRNAQHFNLLTTKQKLLCQQRVTVVCRRGLSHWVVPCCNYLFRTRVWRS